jgi:hypothetical protein
VATQLKHNRRGTDHIYTGQGTGVSLKITLSEGGYRLKLGGEVRYEAMTDRQAESFRVFLHNAIDEALRTGATMRHVNIPLFDLPDEAQTTHIGVNEL